MKKTFFIAEKQNRPLSENPPDRTFNCMQKETFSNRT
jgi:hypothetical protein